MRKLGAVKEKMAKATHISAVPSNKKKSSHWLLFPSSFRFLFFPLPSLFFSYTYPLYKRISPQI
jgi:hypothetical protein